MFVLIIQYIPVKTNIMNGKCKQRIRRFMMMIFVVNLDNAIEERKNITKENDMV